MPIPLITPQLVEGVSEMLWDFGFRWHADLQTKWIIGSAGLGMVAQLSDKTPAEDDFEQSAEEFLTATNPEVLAAVKNASPEDRKQMLNKLEKNFEELNRLISVLKDD
jgi:hypothetical protein